MADSTLDAIRLKVRRLTRSPSEAQLTTDQIDEYVNNFVLFDFPEHLRLFAMRKTFTFFTEPYQDVYNSENAADELDDFKNEYITIHEPIYIDGRRAPLYQDREKFYGLYPRTNSRVTIATGDGATMLFQGTLTNKPIVQSNVLFSSVDANNTTLELHDSNPNIPTNLGALTGNGTGTINYVTGEYSLLFTNPPAANTKIVSHTIPYVASVPQALLYFNNEFTVRPIPDQAYRIDMEVYRRPTILLSNNQSPDIEQWHQYISYGAAKKVLEDRLDEEGVRMIMPEFKTQERLVLRRTIVQNTNNRVATIYTDRLDGQGRNSWWNNNN